MSSSEPVAVLLSRGELDAVLFDLDGVVTRTAQVHAAAWKRLFDTYLWKHAADPVRDFRPFTQEDYRRDVDGRPRLEGIRCFLASRGLSLPEGSPADGPDAETIHGMGERKNKYQEHLLHGAHRRLCAFCRRRARA